MIDIRDDDKYVISLRKFYARHKRPPKWTELNSRHGMHTSSAYIRHFKEHSMDSIYGAVLGIETVMQAIERFIRIKSHDFTKDCFYTHAKEIAASTGVPNGKVRACIAGMVKSKSPTIAGYTLRRYTKGSSTHFVYKFTRQKLP